MLDPLSIHIPAPPAAPILPSLPTRKLLVPSPDHPDDYVLEIDNSSLEPFTICARKAENKLVRSREARRDQSALLFGNLFHKCEELRLRHGLTADVVAQQRKMVQDHFLLHPVSPDDHRTGPRMIDILNKYNTLYAQDHWPSRVVQHEGAPLVERAFKIELCSIPIDGMIAIEPELLLTDASKAERRVRPSTGVSGFYVRNLHVLWTGRIDVVIDEGPFRFIVDHKTSSTGGNEFASAFHLATQTVGYTWAAQHILGTPVHGCLINQVLIKPPLKTAKSSSPREEFNRDPYFYDESRIAEWLTSTRHIVTDFVSCLVRGYFPLTGPKSFKSPCTYCDFHDNCRLPVSQRAADLANDSLYRDVTWRPDND